MAETVQFTLEVIGLDTDEKIRLSPGTAVMGRQVGNDVLLEHALVSRRHAQIDCTPTGCTVTDLGSSNGTAVNEEKLTANVPQPLKDGDIIQVGPFTLTLRQEVVAAEPEPEPEPKPAPPPPKPKPKPKPEPAKAESPPPKPKPKRPSTPKKAPPSPPAPPPPSVTLPQPNGLIPPGLSIHSARLLPYLPGIYHTDFMSRFLGIFEAILTPIEWNINNFDLFMNPGESPSHFLPWLAQWYEISFDDSWDEAKKRALLKDAHLIYGRRGTRWALERILEIYTGSTPEIDDLSSDLEPFTFTIRIPLRKRELNQELIERIIDMNKPAHTTYKLKFKR